MARVTLVCGLSDSRRSGAMREAVICLLRQLVYVCPPGASVYKHNTIRRVSSIRLASCDGIDMVLGISVLAQTAWWVKGSGAFTLCSSVSEDGFMQHDAN